MLIAPSSPAIKALVDVVALFLVGTPREGLIEGLPGMPTRRGLEGPTCPCSVVREHYAPSPALLSLFVALTDVGWARRVPLGELLVQPPPSCPKRISNVLLFLPVGGCERTSVAELERAVRFLDGVAELVSGSSAVFSLQSPGMVPALRTAFRRDVLPALPTAVRRYRFNAYAQAALLIAHCGGEAAAIEHVARAAERGALDVGTEPALDEGWTAVEGLIVPFARWVTDQAPAYASVEHISSAASFANTLTLAAVARMAGSNEGPAIAPRLVRACKAMNHAVAVRDSSIVIYDDLLHQSESLLANPIMWASLSSFAQKPFNTLM